MENNAALVAGLIAVVVAALMYVIAYPFLSGDAKAQKRAAALMSNTKERSVAARTSNDPAKRRKAIADTLKEFESQNKKKKVTIEQRIAQAGLTITPTGYFIACAVCGLALAGDPVRRQRQYARRRGRRGRRGVRFAELGSVIPSQSAHQPNSSRNFPAR